VSLQTAFSICIQVLAEAVASGDSLDAALKVTDIKLGGGKKTVGRPARHACRNHVSSFRGVCAHGQQAAVNWLHSTSQGATACKCRSRWPTLCQTIRSGMRRAPWRTSMTDRAWGTHNSEGSDGEEQREFQRLADARRELPNNHAFHCCTSNVRQVPVDQQITCNCVFSTTWITVCREWPVSSRGFTHHTCPITTRCLPAPARA
jgi:hypothetical protein